MSVLPQTTNRACQLLAPISHLAQGRVEPRQPALNDSGAAPVFPALWSECMPTITTITLITTTIIVIYTHTLPVQLHTQLCLPLQVRALCRILPCSPDRQHQCELRQVVGVAVRVLCAAERQHRLEQLPAASGRAGGVHGGGVREGVGVSVGVVDVGVMGVRDCVGVEGVAALAEGVGLG